MMLPRKRSRSHTDAGASTSDDPTQPDLAPQLIHVPLREGDDALKSCFDHVWREVEVPWVRVPFGAPPAVLLTASHGSAEVTWCNAGRPGAHPLRLANGAQLCAAHSVFARLEALFTPSPSIRHPVLGQMPQGFVFKCGDHGLGWYRDRYDERVLKQGLAVPSSDRLPPAEVPVARPLYPEQASCVAWLLARRNEAVFVASAEEVVPLPHPGLGIAVRGYTRVDEGSPALLCHSVGFGKTACALALAAVHLAGQTPTRTLVVCPAHLVHQWESEAAKLLPTRRTARLEPGASSLPAAEILIATPGGFKQVARRAPSLIGGTPPWLLLLDEAHELASDTTLHEALVALPAAQRVLLTATPPLQDMPALSQLAALAGVAVPARPGELRHFLDACARTSAWTARGISLEHATVRCRLTRSEQLLYFSERQRVRYEATTTQGAQRLLRACTQFSADEAETLESSVQRELRRRKAELASAEAVLATNGAGQHKAELANASSGASSAAADEERAVRAAASVRYFELAMRAARGEEAGEEAPTCSICLEGLATEAASITVCGHTFHTRCIEAACPFEGYSIRERCPICRAELVPNDIEAASQFCEAEEEEEEEEEEQQQQQQQQQQQKQQQRRQRQQRQQLDPGRFGSKIAHILAALRAIHAAEGASAKVVIMAQWPEVLARLRRALGEHGVAALTLDGGALAVQHTLRTFIEGDGASSAVLLLSTAEHCSGLTLTCARHLFLVHPFFGDDERQAAAVEQQAVGRLWRRGQRGTVRVVRFVARNSIEEALSVRQQERVFAALQGRAA